MQTPDPTSTAANQFAAPSAPALTIRITSPATPVALPRIGAWWDTQGGYFAGMVRAADGGPDHLLILCADKPTEGMPWQEAMAWASALRMDGHADWALPTRAESALLFANLREQFKPSLHWTAEQYLRASAWGQQFDVGSQRTVGKGCTARARAVRRLVIDSFSQS